MKQTRKQEARHLLQTVLRGPAFGGSGDPKKQYRLWSTSYVLGSLKRLIPELKTADLPPVTAKLDPYWDKL